MSTALIFTLCYSIFSLELILGYRTWVPKEYFAQAMSFFMRERGALTILLHPLTRHEVEDHSGLLLHCLTDRPCALKWRFFSGRAMWLGRQVSIDLTALSVDRGTG